MIRKYLERMYKAVVYNSFIKSVSAGFGRISIFPSTDRRKWLRHRVTAESLIEESWRRVGNNIQRAIDKQNAKRESNDYENK